MTATGTLQEQIQKTEALLRQHKAQQEHMEEYTTMPTKEWISSEVFDAISWTATEASQCIFDLLEGQWNEPALWDRVKEIADVFADQKRQTSQFNGCRKVSLFCDLMTAGFVAAYREHIEGPFKQQQQQNAADERNDTWERIYEAVEGWENEDLNELADELEDRLTREETAQKLRKDLADFKRWQAEQKAKEQSYD